MSQNRPSHSGELKERQLVLESIHSTRSGSPVQHGDRKWGPVIRSDRLSANSVATLSLIRLLGTRTPASRGM
ncbi:uncharacterized protein TrAtP1_000603 [Trichoderma atroviride]|uniref:uncharacterized protein n=1 Tax=Hypocrea atroviridis TaxID=63577 RepID=UPI0033241C56|nr:hypothetical protein TrAtP1_000603 [Trichoderma atroviride]